MKRNNSEYFEGEMTMSIGPETLGQVTAWNHASEIPYHGGECAKVRGSAGDFFEFPEDAKQFTLFKTDICQWSKLDFDKEINYKGLKLRRYKMERSFLDNG